MDQANAVGLTSIEGSFFTTRRYASAVCLYAVALSVVGLYAVALCLSVCVRLSAKELRRGIFVSQTSLQICKGAAPEDILNHGQAISKNYVV